MKKTSLFTLGLFVSVMMFAQDQEPKLRTDMEVKTRFGIKAGVNLATLEIDDDLNPNMNTNMKTSIHGSVFANIPIVKSFRIQPEIMYSIQGTKTDGVTNPTQLAGLTEYDFHYFSVPIMFQYWPGDHGFYVELGPQFSYLSSANGDRTDDNSAVNLKDNNYIRKTDVAASGGIGYLSRVGLGLNTRYVYGISNVWNADDAPATTSGWDYANRTIQFSLIYHIGANK